MPSWNTPSTRMLMIAVGVSVSFPPRQKGSPTRKAKIWPISTALKRSSPLSEPMAMNMPAMIMPASIATQLPRI